MTLEVRRPDSLRILITGNLGYIGSHVTKLLASLDIDVYGLDNLHRGSTANAFCRTDILDIRDEKSLHTLFKEFDFNLVCHFAGLTSVPESMEKPDLYHEVNVEGTETLLRVMKEHGCNKFIFSSTASVYKQSNTPVKETDVLQPLNNYAKNKLEVETLIKQNSDWLDAIIFRYFNVVGWDDEYSIERELEKTNIVPALYRAVMHGHKFEVFGNGYPVKRENPKDHTCVRDYIDVRDIARAYLAAISYIDKVRGNETFNLGTKTGYSVLEVIDAFSKATGQTINYTIAPPRKGDPAIVVADNQKAKELLDWQPTYSLTESFNIL